jgi:hypothetical protein
LPVQRLEADWKRGLRLAGGGDPGDDLEAANQIGGAVRFGKAGVTVRRGQSELRRVAGDIKDTGRLPTGGS